MKISNMDQYDDAANTKISLQMSGLRDGLDLKLQAMKNYSRTELSNFWV